MNGAVVQLGVRKDTLSSQVIRYLLDRIAREGLQTGDPAPSEVEVAQDLKVSRGTVREAYRSLAALGILEIESGKRPRVRGLDASGLTQIIGFALRAAHVNASQVVQLRRAVEIEAARLAAQYGTEAQFDRLRECVAEMSEAGTDHARMIAADVALHITLAEATQNPMFTLMIKGLRGPLEESMAEGLRGQRTREEFLEVPRAHKALVQRICARDSDGAAQAMARHFDISVAGIMSAQLNKKSTAKRSR
jgi:GntR family transcriptional regulator, transcriptional repressor for pyruvate dehydrogenase complex